MISDTIGVHLLSYIQYSFSPPIAIQTTKKRNTKQKAVTSPNTEPHSIKKNLTQGKLNCQQANHLFQKEIISQTIQIIGDKGVKDAETRGGSQE